jgi:hypothetical protein
MSSPSWSAGHRERERCVEKVLYGRRACDRADGDKLNMRTSADPLELSPCAANLASGHIYFLMLLWRATPAQGL